MCVLIRPSKCVTHTSGFDTPKWLCTLMEGVPISVMMLCVCHWKPLSNYHVPLLSAHTHTHTYGHEYNVLSVLIQCWSVSGKNELTYSISKEAYDRKLDVVGKIL